MVQQNKIQIPPTHRSFLQTEGNYRLDSINSGRHYYNRRAITSQMSVEEQFSLLE
jgi:hypothetical protein